MHKQLGLFKNNNIQRSFYFSHLEMINKSITFRYDDIYQGKPYSNPFPELINTKQ